MLLWLLIVRIVMVSCEVGGWTICIWVLGITGEYVQIHIWL